MRIVLLFTICQFIILGLPVKTFAFESCDYSPDSISNDTIEAQVLDEVVVSAELQKRVGNEDIITFTKKMREGTKNTGELLGKIPGMFFNPLSSELLYRGTENVIVLVDGMEKNADYVKQLQPGRFEKVVITNMPTGMYSGYDAVINLFTKPTYTGYEGLAMGEGVFATDGRNGEDKSAKRARGAGQFTYTREKFNFDFSGGYTFEQTGVADYVSKLYPLNELKETTIERPFRHPNKNNRSNKYFAEFAFDYDINQQHSLSAKVSLMPSSAHESTFYEMQKIFSASNICDTIKEWHNYSISGRLDYQIGVWYRYNYRNWKVNANLTYNKIAYRSYNDLLKSTGYVNDDNRRVSSQYIAGGVEASCQSNNSLWSFSFSNNFIASKFKENQLETYKSLSKSRDFRNSINVGLQYQASKKFSFGLNAGFSVFHNAYSGTSETHVTPKTGAQILWVPSNKAVFRANYTLYTRYPPLTKLQDYGLFTDSLMFYEGNPHLKPSLNHELTLSGTFFNCLTLEGRYYRTPNSICDYYSPVEGALPSGTISPYTRISPVNTDKQMWSVNLTYSNYFGRHWMIAVSAKIIGNKYQYKDSHTTKVLPEYNWFVMYQCMEGTMQCYLSGGMQSYSFFTPQSSQWCLDDGYALAISKTFFKNKLQIQGMWYMPFHLSSGKWHGGISSPSYVSRYWADNQSRKNNMLQLSVLYRFNGGKSVKKYNRQTGTVEL